MTPGAILGTIIAAGFYASIAAYGLVCEARHWLERRRERTIEAREKWDAYWAAQESTLHAEPVEIVDWFDCAGEDLDWLGFADSLADIRALPCAEPQRELRS